MLSYIILGSSVLLGIAATWIINRNLRKLLHSEFRKGFNLAFFSTQDIILNVFGSSDLSKVSGYTTMKRILAESDKLLRNAYPTIDFGPGVTETLERIENEVAQNKTIQFPNSGNSTLN